MLDNEMAIEQVLDLPVRAKNKSLYPRDFVWVAVPEFCGCNYDLRVTIGYVDEELHVTYPSAQRIATIMQSTCDFCIAKEFDTSRLPALYGSEKQVEWANSVRLKFMLKHPEVGAKPNVITEASIWIDYRSVLADFFSYKEESLAAFNEFRADKRRKREEQVRKNVEGNVGQPSKH